MLAVFLIVVLVNIYLCIGMRMTTKLLYNKRILG